MDKSRERNDCIQYGLSRSFSYSGQGYCLLQYAFNLRFGRRFYLDVFAIECCMVAIAFQRGVLFSKACSSSAISRTVVHQDVLLCACTCLYISLFFFSSSFARQNVIRGSMTTWSFDCPCCGPVRASAAGLHRPYHMDGYCLFFQCRSCDRGEDMDEWGFWGETLQGEMRYFRCHESQLTMQVRAHKSCSVWLLNHYGSSDATMLVLSELMNDP